MIRCAIAALALVALTASAQQPPIERQLSDVQAFARALTHQRNVANDQVATLLAELENARRELAEAQKRATECKPEGKNP